MFKKMLVFVILIMAALSGCSQTGKAEDYPEILQSAVQEASPGARILAANKITTTTVYRLQEAQYTNDISISESSAEINGTPVVYSVWCLIYKIPSGENFPMVFIENDQSIYAYTHTHTFPTKNDIAENYRRYYSYRFEELMKAYDECYDVFNLIDPSDR